MRSRMFFSMLCGVFLFSSHHAWAGSFFFPSPSHPVRFASQTSPLRMLSEPLSPEGEVVLAAFILIIPLILGVSTLTSMIGSAYTLHRQGAGQVSLNDKSPLGWGIVSCILGSGSIVYSAVMVVPFAIYGVLWVGIPLLAIGIVALALGIRNIVLYTDMQEKHEFGLAPHERVPFSFGLSFGLASARFTIRF